MCWLVWVLRLEQIAVGGFVFLGPANRGAPPAATVLVAFFLVRIVGVSCFFCGWRICIFDKRYNMLFGWNRGCLQYEFSLVGLSMCRDKRCVQVITRM